MGITDLDEQFTFYASYHHNTLNKIIHIFCVWPILWSAMVLMDYLPVELPPSFFPFLSNIHPLNLTFLSAIFYGSVYILMDKKVGTLAAGLVFFCLFTGRNFYLNSVTSFGYPAWQVALLINVVAWVLQFIGHGFFEGRAPALFDNLMQAFVMAPLFVLLEVMFLFGFRKDFQKTIWKKVEAEIAKLNSKQKR